MCEDMWEEMCVDMCAEVPIFMDMCIDMGVATCEHMFVFASIVYTDMGTDMGIDPRSHRHVRDMCMETWVDMRRDTCVDM